MGTSVLSLPAAVYIRAGFPVVTVSLFLLLFSVWPLYLVVQKLFNQSSVLLEGKLL